MNNPIDNQKELSDFFSYHPWQWFVSLTMPDKSDNEALERALKKWRRILYSTINCQVAYTGIYIYGKTKHSHLLMLSKRNKSGQTLADLPGGQILQLEKQWFAITGRTARIEPAYSPEGAAAYMACHNNASTYPWEPIMPCGERLLNKLKPIKKAA